MPRMRGTLQLLLLFLQSQKGTQKKGDENSYHTVNGIVGGDILFPLNVSLKTEIQEIDWRFNSEGLQLLSLGLGAHSLVWHSPLDRYRERLAVLEDASLIIRNLTHKDDGFYEARVTFISGVFTIQSFHLSVYDLIPLPKIHIQSLCLTLFWCNITLDCQVSEPGITATVSWRSWNLLGELEISEMSEMSLNSTTLSLSLPLSQSNSSLTCLASNPVDQRNITIHLMDICVPRDIYGSEKAQKEPVNVYSCPLEWILLWKGLFLLGILLWTLGIRFTRNKGKTEQGRSVKHKMNKTQAHQVFKKMHCKADYFPHLIFQGPETPVKKKPTDWNHPGLSIQNLHAWPRDKAAFSPPSTHSRAKRSTSPSCDRCAELITLDYL